MADQWKGTPAGWTRRELEAFGFIGWVGFSDLRSHLTSIRAEEGGFYIIFRTGTAAPRFVATALGSTWRGDPNVPLDDLIANWVANQNVVYIGKATHGQLRHRLRAYRSFGEGGKGRHWGGRLVWQLADCEELLVAWQAIDARFDPLQAEGMLIESFKSMNGKRPFANNPDRLGA